MAGHRSPRKLSMRRLAERSRPLIAVAGSALLMAAVLVGVGVRGWGDPDPAAQETAQSVEPGPSQPPKSEAPEQVLKPDREKAERRAQQKLRRIERLAQKAQKREQRKKQRREEAKRTAPVELRIAVFNVLGSNHTRKGGSASGYASGTTRMGRASAIVERQGMDIIGFSEIQGDQLAVFKQNHGDFGVYPDKSLGHSGIPTNLAWRESRFEFVSGETVTIPFMDQRRPMPVVKLRDRETEREFYVMNAHNSPNSRQGERNEALAAEIAKLRELEATGDPVFFVGDLNEKDAALCKVVDQTTLQAASPSGNLDGCAPWRGMRLDWIFGAGVTFSDYVQDRADPVPSVTDHAVVVATATLQ